MTLQARYARVREAKKGASLTSQGHIPCGCNRAGARAQVPETDMTAGSAKSRERAAELDRPREGGASATAGEFIDIMYLR